MNKVSCLVCVAILMIAPIANSQEGAREDRPLPSLMVSRDRDGSIAGESRAALRRLLRIANERGHAQVWVTLDTPFDPFLSQKLGANAATEQAAEQQQRVDKLFDEVLSPLLRGGLAQYPTGEREYRGPSIAVEVTEKGLRRLARDRRVGQLVGVRAIIHDRRIRD